MDTTHQDGASTIRLSQSFWGRLHLETAFYAHQHETQVVLSMQRSFNMTRPVTLPAYEVPELDRAYDLHANSSESVTRVLGAPRLWELLSDPIILKSRGFELHVRGDTNPGRMTMRCDWRQSEALRVKLLGALLDVLRVVRAMPRDRDCVSAAIRFLQKGPRRTIISNGTPAVMLWNPVYARWLAVTHLYNLPHEEAVVELARAALDRNLTIAAAALEAMRDTAELRHILPIFGDLTDRYLRSPLDDNFRTAWRRLVRRLGEEEPLERLHALLAGDLSMELTALEGSPLWERWVILVRQIVAAYELEPAVLERLQSFLKRFDGLERLPRAATVSDATAETLPKPATAPSETDPSLPMPAGEDTVE